MFNANHLMHSDFTIGFLGDGQLARMSALCAIEMGFRVAFLAENANSPCAELGRVIVGRRNDRDALMKLFSMCDVLTLENEFVDASLIASVGVATGKPCLPSPDSFSKIQSKFKQKELFQKHGLDVASVAWIGNSAADGMEHAKNFGAKHGFPFLLKSELGGYDGYGNYTVRSEQDLSEAFSKLKGSLYAEAFVSFESEWSLIAVRTKDEICFYPLARTIQQDHICKWVTVGKTEILPDHEIQLRKKVAALLSDLQYEGVFALELFRLRDGTFIANECAPRPHNSGHWTQNAARTSQFEQQVRVVSGLHLGSTEMTANFAGMWNFLGWNTSAPVDLRFVSALLKLSSCAFHSYGKSASRVGRKLGHLNFWADTSIDFEDKLRQIQAIEKSAQGN